MEPDFDRTENRSYQVGDKNGITDYDATTVSIGFW